MDFSQFTQLYELSKTLCFRLFPFLQTKKQLEIDEIIEKDRKVERNYEKIKEKFDDLHILFVEKALENSELSSLEEYAHLYNKMIALQTKKRKTKEDNILLKSITLAFEKQEKNTRKELTSFFHAMGNKWLEEYPFLDGNGTDILTKKEVLLLLSHIFPEKKELFDSFKGFFTYFDTFKESRKNFYADDGRAGAIATRAIDENFQIFLDNISRFEEFSETYPDFFTEKEKIIFRISYYNSCLLQKGIDQYNQILGAEALEEGRNNEGINQRINLLKQQKEHSNKKHEKYPKFDALNKQILSKKERLDFIPMLESIDELFDTIDHSLEINQGKINLAKELFHTFFSDNNSFNLNQIYLSKTGINTLSSKHCTSWESLSELLGEKGKQKFVSFGEIRQYLSENSEKIFREEYYKKEGFLTEQEDNYRNFLSLLEHEFLDALQEIDSSAKTLKRLEKLDFKKTNAQIEIIKRYFDAMLDFYQITRYWNVDNTGKEERYDKDSTFYTPFDAYFSDFALWKVYNLVRNYLTKKEVQTDMFKLNFDNSQFLSGWDRDKEMERYGMILRKEEKYYLAILRKNNTKIIEQYTYKGESEYYEKMEYKQLNNVFRQLPRLTFPLQKKLEKITGDEREAYLKKYRENFDYNDEIATIKQEFDAFQESKEKGEKFDQQKLEKLIHYYQKAVLFLYGDIYDLRDIANAQYKELNDFYTDIERRMYSLTFSKIGKKFLEDAEEKGEIYVFQIYTKDFSEYKNTQSKDNIHTKYFRYLFSEENLKHLVLKLSGGAEMFFRDKTENLPQAEKNGKKLEYERNGEKKTVLKHKRYSEDALSFHLPITLNANAGEKYQFNAYINENFIPEHIIGIDRGEKNLAYAAILDKNGNPINIIGLNSVNGIDYLTKLEEKEKSRAEGRLNWTEIENIKNLKDGYISALVKRLSDLIIQYRAMIVFEDLNLGFKRGRQKIERQVYQKLELALAKKLNYLTFKERADTDVGGVLRGIQLVPKVVTYADIGSYKQSGIMLYTNPAYTSTTCPKCGWRKMLKFPTTLTKSSIQKFFQDISLHYDGKRFVFSYTIEDTAFALYSDVERTLWDNRNRETKHYRDITRDITLALQKVGIEMKGNILSELDQREVSLDTLKSILFAFKLINSIRNNDSKNKEDIISCPSCHYNSKDGFHGFEFNGDANGALNIARKGLIMLRNIRTNPEKPNLYVSDQDWDRFVRNKKTTLLDIINE